VLQKYSDKPLPREVKAPAYLISIPEFEAKEFAPIILGADSAVFDSPLLTMEDMDMGWGSMIYATTLPEISTSSVLTLNDCHDFAQVFVDDKYIGKIDRVKNEKSILLPPVQKGQELKILLEAMGRINFGRAIKDYKGITDNVTVSAEVDGNDVTWNLKRWTILTIPDDYSAAAKALASAQSAKDSLRGAGGAGYYRGYFKLSKRGDTFLNLSNFGKGQVYVNGYPIGRFWNIGPQQTLYVPACWMKRGLNEVVVLDVVGPAKMTLWAQDKPELDQLNLEKSVTHNNPGDKPDLNSATPVAAGSFAPGNGWQTVRFAAPAKGRYIALQALSTHEGKDNVCVAEVYALGKDGKRISREPWTVKYADSEEIIRGNNLADKVFDLQESTYWRTAKGATLPHLMVVDLGSVQQLSGFEYLPRAEEGAPGSIKDYRIFVY
jgi:beta-galactosidase